MPKTTRAARPTVPRGSIAALLCAASLFAAVAHGADPRIAAAGDIACDPADPQYNGGQGTASGCQMRATSDLLLANPPDALLLLGDNQYEDGALPKYRASYHPTWGRLLAITHPAPGNHDYGTPGAAGYYSYFGAAAGPAGQGYYSFDLGAWHLIALNSNCAAVGGCGRGSAQQRWLQADLAAHPGVCTLAYWHHPRFSSGPHGNDASYRAFWEDLYAAGADLVLVGHDHDYERFAPQDPDGAADPGRGIRQFVVGTGGRNLRPFPTIAANSEARSASSYGVLRLTLKNDGYDWRFATAAGTAYTDAGAATCHSARTVLELDRGRFRAAVTWKDFAGNTGSGFVVPTPASDASGLFWFFQPTNWELLVKVLDGCALNGRHWVFSAATTNVEYHLTVTDTVSGAVRAYDNPLGRASPAVTDTNAFATCP